MKAEDLCVFLTSYSITVAFAAVAEFLRRRQTTSLIAVVVSLLAICATTVVGFYLQPGTSYLSLIWSFIIQRDFSFGVSLAMGLAAALVWVTQLTATATPLDQDTRRGLFGRLLRQSILAASILGVVVCSQAFIWKSLSGVTRDPPSRVHASGFVIEKIADLDYLPVRVAAGDDGTVYVSYDYFEIWGDIGAAIIRLEPDQATGKFAKRIVADSTLLMRTYGLAVRDGELFVSRSGIFGTASRGKITYESSGAVTQLKDLDQDGYFEYMHDIVTGLPGARGPDTMQQNNGIVFAPDGSLFVTCGCSADRDLDEHPWGGVILRTSPDYSTTEVFARGFRNPFGIAIGPDDELFVTDNDIDENPGDELNHVVGGAHYGHPYVVPGEEHIDPSGFREPIFVGGPESNLLGLAYATSPQLPEPYRDCLYVTDFMENAVWRMTLARDNDTYKVTGVFPFATVSSPVDITVTDAGEFYIVSRRGKIVYRIRPSQDLSGERR